MSSPFSSDRFRVVPLASLDALVGSLKRDLKGRLGPDYAPCLPDVLIRRALDDAEELARTTDFPHLFLPLIAEEKLDRVSRAVCSGAPEPTPRGLSRAA